jgi:hypothetical protein
MVGVQEGEVGLSKTSALPLLSAAESALHLAELSLPAHTHQRETLHFPIIAK